ncbi:hypothetical protein M5K25_025674 [Dendrobium thyrsiflorum]|uniref:UDP-glucose 4-epimerase n=1 Tax=Dendrobium thyrsiflorum TaxID=117978 RepID=A0ABD0U4U0_DENTH
MRWQMKAKDREISQLNEKMTKMISQMMAMMQRTAIAGTTPTPSADPPNLQMPQVSGLRAYYAECSKGHTYPVEYDQVPYPKGYSVLKLNTFNGNNNPRQHLTQFKATCDNTGDNDALLFQQFTSSLTVPVFEWYAELPNDYVKMFAELETMFVKRFASATEKITIANFALDKRKNDEVAKFKKLNLSRSESHSDKSKKAKASSARRGEAGSTFFFRADKVRDYIHVVDLADGHIAALQKLFQDPNIGCEVYNLGTGKGTSVLEMVAAFEKAYGKKIPLVMAARRSGDAEIVYASTKKAERELNWRAKYGIDEMCRDQWNWARKNPWGYGSPESES